MEKQTRKLKRGLKDISPLFQEGKPHSTPLPSLEKSGPAHRPVECLYVMSPNHQEDSMLLNTYLAACLSKMRQPCMILSVHPGSSKESLALENPLDLGDSHLPPAETLANGLKRFSLNWSQFFQGCQSREHLETFKMHEPPFLFFDFDCVKAPSLEKVIPLMDKWIFVVEPEPYNIQETYKTIKASRIFNPHLEYFMIYEGSQTDGRGERLYEKLSEMLTRRLGVSLSWLGSLHFPEGKKPVSKELMLDDLLGKNKSLCESLEKQALLRYLATIENGSIGVAV